MITAPPSTLSRRLAHRTATATVAVATGALLLTGFIRISFGPTQPDFSWRSPPVTFVVQSQGSRDVSDSSELTAIRLAFQSWTQDPNGSIRLVEDTAANATRRDYQATDIHLAMFDDDGATGLFPPGSGIVALTPIVAQVADGSIVDADIVFNGRDHSFTTNGTRGRFDVQAVATHEVGHFLGLDHSGGPRSTMYQAVETGATHPRAIKRDEQAFLAAAYPRDTATGSISGTIAKSAGGNVGFGHVVAVDATTGEIGGGTTTDGAGNYRLRGLRAGSYLLYVEPLDGPVYPASTTRLSSVTADSFATTYFPGSAVTAPSGGETSGVSWSVGAAPPLNVNDSDQGGVIAGGPTTTVTCAGAGMGTITQASVPGTGVRVVSISRATFNGTPAVSVTLTADADAARGVRPLELRDAQNRLVILTAGVQVLDLQPTILRVTPTVLDGGAELQIDGTGFRAPVSVVVGGLAATNVRLTGSTFIAAAAPRADVVGVPVDVVVIGADGQEARLAGGVTFSATPVPQSVDPAIGPATGGTRHRILGSGFVSPVQVRVGNVAATSTTFVSSTEVDFVLPPSDLLGAVDVTLVSGGISRTLPRALTYVDGVAPQVDAFSPTSGPASGGTVVTIDGKSFPQTAQVLFGTTNATSVSTTSSTRIIATAPPHAAGSVDVRVVDPRTGLVGIAPATFSYDGSTAVIAAPVTGGGSGGGGGCTFGGAPGASPLALAPLALAWVGLIAARRRSA